MAVHTFNHSAGEVAGMAVHTFNRSTAEAEKGGSLNLRPVCSNSKFQASDTPFKNKQETRVPFPETIYRSVTQLYTNLAPITPFSTARTQAQLVPFQNYSLYGIQVRFRPIFSAHLMNQPASIFGRAILS